VNLRVGQLVPKVGRPTGFVPPRGVAHCFYTPNRRSEAVSRRPRLATKTEKTLNNGYLGSRIDEERSEMRYVV